MSNELIQKNVNLPAGIDEDIYLQTMQETAESTTFIPPKIKIATGGANVFQRGEESFRVIEKAIIFFIQKNNAFWVPTEREPLERFNQMMNGYNPEPSEVPLCASPNAINALHEKMEVNGKYAFGHCTGCILNQFGSDLKGGRGKACKNGYRLWMFLPGSSVPNILMLPPTSINPFNEYVSALRGYNLNPMIVYNTIGLEKKSNTANQIYSVARFELVGDPKAMILNPEDAALMKKYRDEFEESAKKLIASLDEFEPVEKETEPVDAEEVTGDESGLFADEDQIAIVKDLLIEKKINKEIKATADEILGKKNPETDEVRWLYEQLKQLPDKK